MSINAVTACKSFLADPLRSVQRTEAVSSLEKGNEDMSQVTLASSAGSNPEGESYPPAALYARIADLEISLRAIYSRCVCITQSDPMLTGPTREMVLEIGDLASASSSTAADDPRLPEIPCCPVHEALYRAAKVEPLDNCFVCIRNQRDELKEEVKFLDWMRKVAPETLLAWRNNFESSSFSGRP